MKIKFTSIAVLAVAILTFTLIYPFGENKSTQTFVYPTGFADEAIVLSCSSDSSAPTTQQQADFVHQLYLDNFKAVTAAVGIAMHEETQRANEMGDMPNFRLAERTGHQLLINLTENIRQQFGCAVSIVEAVSL